MTILERINTFIDIKGYKDDPHCLGVLFYGSSLTGFNKENSDIDLHVIFDDSDPTHLIRANYVIDDVPIEYFEKTLGEVYLTIENDFKEQNNAPLSIFGKSKIIYARDNRLAKLQEYTINKFSRPLPPLSINEARECVSIINNRMEKLYAYSITDDPYFEHLYHLTIEKIRRFYHNRMGIPRIETVKGFRLYRDEEYRKSFYIDKIPEQEFLDIYFKAVSEENLSNQEKYQLLNKLYTYAKGEIALGDDYRIPIKSRSTVINDDREYPKTIDKRESITIPTDISNKISTFIYEMGYINDPHCLGIIVCGSSITGFNTKDSDIDLQVIFDNDDSVIIRGNKKINGTRIEYFEKPMDDIFNAIDTEYLNQDNALYSIIGKGAIVFERGEWVSLLKQYAIDVFSKPLPPLTFDKAREKVSILNNRMKNLKELAINDSPEFDHVYHLVIDMIRKFYHKLNGLPKIATSKVYRIYTDDAYRESICKINPETEFVNMFIELITVKCNDKLKKYQMVERFFNYATRGINIEKNYMIPIESKYYKKESSKQCIKKNCMFAQLFKI